VFGGVPDTRVIGHAWIVGANPEVAPRVLKA
jgi:hypothetical protein